MGKKSRIDTVAGNQQIAAAAFKDLKAPAHVPLSQEDIPFFNAVIAEFARAEWTEHQLEMAALLARAMCDMERESRLLREEGTVTTTPKGWVTVNPRKTAVQMFAGTILSMRRSLSLHARVNQGNPASVQKRQKLAKEIENNIRGIDDDELLASPAKH